MKLCFVSVNGPREPYLLDEPRTCKYVQKSTMKGLWHPALLARAGNTKTTSSQFACTVTASNEGGRMKEDKRTEDSKRERETRRAACNLLHPKFSGDAPPRRVVAANPPSRGCVREGKATD
jgi:hypothetical protein